MQKQQKLQLPVLISFVLFLSACSLSSGEVEETTTREVAKSTGMTTNYDKAYQNYLQLGAQYYASGNYEMAEARLMRAIEINAEKPEAWHGLANVYEAQQNIAAGEQVYEKLINAHPTYQQGYFDYAKFLCKFNRNAERKKLYETMRAKGPEFQNLAATAEGNCEKERGNSAGARAAYQQSLNLNDKSPDALLSLAQIAVEQGNYGEALSHIQTLHTYQAVTPETLKLGILAARGLNDAAAEQNFIRIMRSQKRFSTSPQAKELGL
ncbi:MAG: tetratricopeptide repeat protein [Cardiobacteriaceae bacterium]|nr:tetratricopeptide repeat protein [Cardiobacteriaceae bacterium]